MKNEIQVTLRCLEERITQIKIANTAGRGLLVETINDGLIGNLGEMRSKENMKIMLGY